MRTAMRFASNEELFRIVAPAMAVSKKNDRMPVSLRTIATNILRSTDTPDARSLQVSIDTTRVAAYFLTSLQAGRAPSAPGRSCVPHNGSRVSPLHRHSTAEQMNEKILALPA